MAMSVSGLTATFFRLTPAAGLLAAAGIMTLTSAFPLPSSCIPDASSTGARIVAGFSSRSLIG
jgi:hypothetical protein